MAPDRTTRLTRRRYLTLTATGALGSLSGCTDTPTDDSLTAPVVSPGSQWAKQRSIERRGTTSGVGYAVKGALYTNTALAESLKLLPDDMNVPTLAAVFAAQANVYVTKVWGQLTIGRVTSARILNQSVPPIQSRLSTEYNIGSFKSHTHRGDKPTRADAYREYLAVYPITRREEVVLPDGETRRTTLTGALPVTAFFTCWQITDSEDYLVAGAVFPAASTVQLSGRVTQGITANIEVDFAFDPEELRSAALNFINKRISPSNSS